MNELNNFLSNFETRIDVDGNELLKPEYKDYCATPNNYESLDSLRWIEANETYNNATRVIELPDWKVLVIKANNKIATCQLKGNFSLISDYCASMNLKPTIEMFVRWKDGEVLEEPDKEDFIFESHLELVGNPKEYNEEEYNQACEQFQAAQSKVQFFGWEVYESKMIGITISNGEDIATFRPDGTVLVFGAHKSKCDTIDDLNREVQLLMIVK